MKFHGCFEVVKEKCHIRMRHYEGNAEYDLVFDCNSEPTLTVTLSEEQVIALFGVVYDAVEIWTEYGIPYHV